MNNKDMQKMIDDFESRNQNSEKLDYIVDLVEKGLYTEEDMLYLFGDLDNLELDLVKEMYANLKTMHTPLYKILND